MSFFVNLSNFQIVLESPDRSHFIGDFTKSVPDQVLQIEIDNDKENIIILSQKSVSPAPQNHLLSFDSTLTKYVPEPNFLNLTPPQISTSPISVCSQYREAGCARCLLVKDPHCGWCEMSGNTQQTAEFILYITRRGPLQCSGLVKFENCFPFHDVWLLCEAQICPILTLYYPGKCTELDECSSLMWRSSGTCTSIDLVSPSTQSMSKQSPNHQVVYTFSVSTSYHLHRVLQLGLMIRSQDHPGFLDPPNLDSLNPLKITCYSHHCFPTLLMFTMLSPLF